MGTEVSDSMIKKTLKKICCGNGWSYGVFWGFDQTNFSLLTLQDSYYEEQMGDVVENMLMQVHVFGGGVVGQAAFTKSHRWIFSDERQNYSGLIGSPQIFQDDSEFYCQFSTGIKTIAVISVEPFGVVQFGSTEKIPESKEFVNQVKQHFSGMSKDRLESSSLDCEIFAGYEDLGYQSMNSLASTYSLFENQFQAGSTEMEQLLLDTAAYFDCSTAPAQSGDSVVTSLLNYEQSESSLYLHGNDQNSTLLLPSNDCKSQSFSNPCKMDDFSQWFSPLPNTGFTTNLPTNSIQSSITESFNSNGKKRCSGIDSLCDWSEIPIPVVNGDRLDFSIDNSKCISERYVGSKVENPNSLFSKLGLDHLLGGTVSSSYSFARSRFEDQISASAKRRKIEDHSWSTSFEGEKKSLNPLYDPKKTSFLEPKHEASTIEGSRIGYNGSMNNSSRGNEGPAKMVKKKAKPGTRPRPKDRQQIQDRLAELRQLIPSGEKMSIDRLLQRTIRHLNFLQSLKKHTESLKQTDKPKMDNSNARDGGVTWACEVGDQSMLCPLIVKDLSSPGQMLIETLCDEQGFFLEIVDVIRNFGLTILKGVMEVQETKIWAHFIVEAEENWHVTRHEIFSSLIQLLQMSPGTSGLNASDNKFGNIMSSGDDTLLNYCQAIVSLPVISADSLQRTTL